MKRLRAFLPFSLALIGLSLLVAAGALVAPVVGIAVAGIALILVAVTLGGDL